MKWLKKTYRWIADHLTKAIGVIGATLLGADATGYLEGVKATALQYLPPNIATQIGKWTGITLFVVVVLRGWYTGSKFERKKADVLPPPDPSAVVKALFIACAVAVGVMAPRAYASQSDKWTELPPSAAQAQASAMAAEAVQPSSEALTSVLVIVQCHVAVSVIDIDATGKMHQWDLDGRSKTDLTEHLQGALKAGAAVMSDNVGCPGNPAKDTPVL